MHKIVITGTGRCGTSFLMQLITNCGLNTGYSKEEAYNAIRKIDGLNAGIEHGINQEKTEKSTYIKNPQWIDTGEFNRLRNKYIISNVLLPVRDLDATAKSREYMNSVTHGAYGGFWMGAHNVEQQKQVNAKMTYNFIHYCALNDIPVTIISFELMMQDPAYLYEKLKLNVSFDMFLNEYHNLLDKDKIRF